MTKVFTLAIDRRRNDSVVDQVRQDIKERMLDKTLIHNDLLPEPHALAKANNVETQEVLKAYQSLLDEGFVNQKNGHYEIARVTIEEKSITSIQSLSEMLKSEGFTPSAVRLSLHEIHPEDEPMLKPFYDSTHRLLALHHVYAGDERPLLYVETYISTKDYDITYDQAKESVHHYVLPKLAYVKRRIDVVKVTPEIAKALNLELSDAVFRVQNVSYTKHHHVLYVTCVYAAPNYTIRIDSEY
mgnify:CR=1 FL=1